jgi:hypothetical protein
VLGVAELTDVEPLADTPALTVTTRDAEPVFPAESVAVYVRVYKPGVAVSTEPASVIELEISLPDTSFAVAPGSIKTSP